VLEASAPPPLGVLDILSRYKPAILGLPLAGEWLTRKTRALVVPSLLTKLIILFNL
jgi:hypothetical protein